HTGHHPEIDVLTDTTATGIWYLTDVFINLAEKVRTTGSAIYRDKYLKQQGQWRIAESVYERMYEEVEAYTEAPRLTAHWLARVPPPAKAQANG
ncbi:MAG TPA: nuclear transport factor 2 family protein, partial [Steroidobacteraceae bacterium]|nr:nuclear transport factor 2 family protein [Steroidobacteraceae bacterium]